MSPDLDRETQAAADVLAHRLRIRDAAIRNGEDYDDPEPFALEYVMGMRLRGGWRPTEARAPQDYRNAPHGDGLPTSEETRRQVEQARRDSAEAAIRRRTLAANPPRGDVA